MYHQKVKYFWHNMIKEEPTEEDIDVDMVEQNRPIFWREITLVKRKQGEHKQGDIDMDNESRKVLAEKKTILQDINEESDEDPENYLQAEDSHTSDFTVQDHSQMMNNMIFIAVPIEISYNSDLKLRKLTLIQEQPSKKTIKNKPEIQSDDDDPDFVPGSARKLRKLACRERASKKDIKKEAGIYSDDYDSDFVLGSAEEPQKPTRRGLASKKDIKKEAGIYSDDDDPDFVPGSARKPRKTTRRGRPSNKDIKKEPGIYSDDYDSDFVLGSAGEPQKTTRRGRPSNKDIKKEPGIYSDVYDPDYVPGSARKPLKNTRRGRPKQTVTTQTARTKNAVHLKEALYHCPRCDKRYFRHGNLINHLEKYCGGTTVKCRPGTSAAAECRPGTSAAAECRPGTSAAAECRPGTSAAAECRPGTSAAVECRPGTSAAAECRPGTSAAVECRPGTSAEAECRPGTSAEAGGAGCSTGGLTGWYASKPVQCPYCLKYYHSGDPMKTHLYTRHKDLIFKA